MCKSSAKYLTILWETQQHLLDSICITYNLCASKNFVFIYLRNIDTHTHTHTYTHTHTQPGEGGWETRERMLPSDGSLPKHLQWLNWAEPKPGACKSTYISHVGDKNPITWAIVAISWVLHLWEADVGSQRWILNPGTEIWDTSILTTRLNACPINIPIFHGY